MLKSAASIQLLPDVATGIPCLRRAGNKLPLPASRCVELGAGVGLVGLALARMGSKVRHSQVLFPSSSGCRLLLYIDFVEQSAPPTLQVVLTDKAAVVPLLKQNITLNKLER